MARVAMWGAFFACWAGFTFWYTNTSGPLTDAEIDNYIRQIESVGGTRDVSPLRTFLESDTGDQFIMVNVIDMADNPPDVEGAPPGESAEGLLGRYMEYMYPALFSRACHPIFAGNAAAPAVDLVGIEGAEQWTSSALMRYRSRRDMMEIAINPEFSGRHEFKVAALEKTIAFPVQSVLYYADPRFLLALILIALCSLLDLLVWRR